MKIVHIANTNFELELRNGLSNENLADSLKKSPFGMQLQFLPLLTAPSNDIVAVNAFPEAKFLKDLENLNWRQNQTLPELKNLFEIDPFQGTTCVSWGASRQVQQWASEREVTYFGPTDWEMIKRINSKAFSMELEPLKGAALIRNEVEFLDWMGRTKSMGVLKTCFGLSGKGNRVVGEGLNPQLLPFCHKEWNEGYPIIAEPWLDKCFDFSTQWMIHPDGRKELLGATVFQNDPSGIYQGTLAGPAQDIFGPYHDFLEEHIEHVQVALNIISNVGFFGHLGVDALLYRRQGDQKVLLHPIVEINARQTMSLVALQVQHRWFPDQPIRLSLETLNRPGISLLPLKIPSISGGKVVSFKRKLVLSFEI
ncbi:MAG: hypothetical protein H0V82_02000 [Candidatus Protochlamydia sp.]|nr:hypothetical protein [Candidatus Protochlamydia sp.]